MNVTIRQTVRRRMLKLEFEAGSRGSLGSARLGFVMANEIVNGQISKWKKPGGAAGSRTSP
jgi:hypothetical protein